MPNTIDVLNEKDAAETKQFTKEDYKRALEALQRLRERAEKMPPVDGVALVREIRDSGERSIFE